MKSCEEFKDLIVTSYIDAQIDKVSKNNLESHLLDCADCRAYLREVKAYAVVPFQNAPLEPVPSQLWDSIAQEIVKQHQSKDLVANIIGQFKGLLALPRLVSILASLMVMFLVGSITYNNINIQKAKSTEQAEYLVSLINPVGNARHG